MATCEPFPASSVETARRILMSHLAIALMAFRSVFEHPERQPSHVVVDPVSLTLLKGATIDFATELIGSSFRIVENPQAEGGCGCGVSWELKASV